MTAKKRLITLAMALFLALAPCAAHAGMYVDYDADSWPLSLPLKAQGAPAFALSGGKLAIPSFTLVHVNGGNPMGDVAFGDIEEDSARLLFQYLAEGEAQPLTEEAASELSMEPVWYFTVAEISEGAYVCVDFIPLRDQDGAYVHVEQVRPTGVALDMMLLVKSAQLKTLLGELCLWEDYQRSDLKDAKEINIYAVDQPQGSTVRLRGRLLGTISKAANAKKLGVGIAGARAIGQNDAQVQAVLEFVLSNGTIRTAYLKPPEAKAKKGSIIAGCDEVFLTKKQLSPILKKLP